MSSLEGLIGLPDLTPATGPVYMPPEETALTVLTHDAVKEFFTTTLPTITQETKPPLPWEGPIAILEKCTEHWSSTISSIMTEEFDPDEFLDGVITSLGLCDDISKRNSVYLLTPLVQALYNLDYNDFTLDIAALHGTELKGSMGLHLEGTPSRALRITYQGKVHAVGYRTKYCDISIEGPLAKGAGFEAEHSEFTIHHLDASTFTSLPFLGTSSRSCIFHIPPLEDLSWMRGSSHIPYIMPWHAVPYDGRYYFSGPLSDEDLRFLKEKGFFKPEGILRKRNHVYVPDGEGDWNEVKP